MADFETNDKQASLDFYVEFLGFEVAMDLEWIATVASSINPSAQVSFFTHEERAPVVPDPTVEVEDVSALHELAKGRDLEIVYPLTDEPWGVRRFFVNDPNGKVVNVMQHLNSEISGAR